MTPAPEKLPAYSDDDLNVILQDWDVLDPTQLVAINLAREVKALRAEAAPLADRRSFKSADELADWLDTFYDTLENGETICNRKWEPAQRAAAAIRSAPLAEGREEIGDSEIALTLRLLTDMHDAGWSKTAHVADRGILWTAHQALGQAIAIIKWAKATPTAQRVAAGDEEVACVSSESYPREVVTYAQVESLRMALLTVTRERNALAASPPRGAVGEVIRPAKVGNAPVGPSVRWYGAAPSAGTPIYTHPAAQADARDADMFWDHSDNERCHDSIIELVSEHYCNGAGPGPVLRIQRAMKLPDVLVRITEKPETETSDAECDYEVIADPAPRWSPKVDDQTYAAALAAPVAVGGA